MAGTFREALERRRTYYEICDQCPVSHEEIKKIIDFAVTQSPSAFNSQSARVILLLGEHHTKLWNIVRETLGKIIPAAHFAPTDKKIAGFAAGHGTVLFYEDQHTIESLQKQYPIYRDAFPGFSANSTGMLQFVVWVMFSDAGLGASLQHYGNLIEAEAAKTWDLPPAWRLMAQMPFGVPTGGPGVRESLPLSEKVKVFK